MITLTNEWIKESIGQGEELENKAAVVPFIEE
jgi:hypothetical protein